ncbi:MAG: SNF2-related protein [Spirochaetota bacterium]|nr:SNF2-related protein [Spirochaetota bacterium]
MESEALTIEESIITKSDIAQIEKSREYPIIKGEGPVLQNIKDYDLTYNPRFELKTEAYLLQLAYTNNKILSLSNSRTKILAHQVECAYKVVNSLNQRFLIADEVGLGKTIEAGLIIKELIIRHDIKKILIICPASLQLQWQNEMQSKFNETFALIDRKTIIKKMKSLSNDNSSLWDSYNKVICSIDFIKNSIYMNSLENSQWDAIIIDEAHRLRKDSFKSTLAYNLAEMLSGRTRAFLLLSATPFRGKLEELYYLIKLIDKNLLGPFQTFFNNYCTNNSNLDSLKENMSSVIIRRTKREVGGFTKRHAKTLKFEFFPEESLLYETTTKYVVEEFNRALQTENRAVGFVMTIFQKLLDSSSYALLSALKKRKNHLSSILNTYKQNNSIVKNFSDADTFYDEEEALEEKEMILASTSKKNFNELVQEINTIENLISIAESINKNRKGEKLKEIIYQINKRKDNKVIIFTQFRATQNYLQEILSEFDVEVFHGSLDRQQKEDAITNFKNRANILICTEAGGEGRNLQFCNVLINYDLPWSPLKIEQRIGRIHRFGQKKDVFIYNFSGKNTIAERILTVLTNKLQLFNDSIGETDVLLGQIEDELNLNSLFMNMASGNISSRKLYAEIDKTITTARKNYENISDLAVSREMDFNYDEYYRVTLKERKYSNHRIEQFVNKVQKIDDYTNQFIGKKHTINNLYPIRRLNNNFRSTKRYGVFNSEKALENENLEFLAFGNPIIDQIFNYCKSNTFGGIAGIKAIKYKKPFAVMSFNYLVTFKSSTSIQELIPVCIDPYNYLTESELIEVEKESMEQFGAERFKTSRYQEEILGMIKIAKRLLTKARKIIIEKAKRKAEVIQGNTIEKIKPEIFKINESYKKVIKELEDQQERQICQMKWFNKDMKSAITRTKNKLKANIDERDALLLKYREYTDVQFAIELINAGFIIKK